MGLVSPDSSFALWTSYFPTFHHRLPMADDDNLPLPSEGALGSAPPKLDPMISPHPTSATSQDTEMTPSQPISQAPLSNPSQLPQTQPATISISTYLTTSTFTFFTSTSTTSSIVTYHPYTSFSNRKPPTFTSRSHKTPPLSCIQAFNLLYTLVSFKSLLLCHMITLSYFSAVSRNK